VQKDLLSFEAACSRCEVRKVLTPVALDVVQSKLVYDKARGGSRGRALVVDLPELGLKRGDRVEPSYEVPNIASLSCVGGDLAVTFWRPGLETAHRHRCPMFGASTGLSSANVGVDWLHTLSLGVFQTWLASVVWALLDANAWNIVGPAAARFELGVGRLREDLFAWYTAEAKEGRRHTRVQKLLPSMFGDTSKHSCSLHGAETNSFLAFSEVLLVRYGAKLGPLLPYHMEACLTLRRILSRIRDFPRIFPLPEIQGFCNDVQRHLWALSNLDVNNKPKHHFLIELAGRFIEHGNHLPHFGVYVCVG
jgi:hypothetical protein